MQILTDRVLAAAGVDYPTALALLNPAKDELIVHVRQELGPSDYVPPPSPTERLNANQHGGAGLRQTYEEEPGAESVVPTIEPTNDGPHTEGHVIGRRADPVHAGDQGYTLGGLRLLAEQQRLSLVYTGGTAGAYVLSGAFGQKFYSSLSQVAGALKFGRW